MNDIKICETEEYDRLVDFFIENELEFSADDPVPTDIIRCWKAEEGGRLMGGCVLAKRQGKFIIDGIAVDPSKRKDGLGSRLLGKAVSLMEDMGGSELFLVARAPDFFRTQGFFSVEKKDAPNFFECLTCPQFGVSCHPEIMKLEV